MSTIAQLTRSGADAFVRLAAKVVEAEEIQWEASPRPRYTEKESSKAAGSHADPTFDAVTDPRRLAVREKVQAAYAQLVHATSAAREATEALDNAIKEWEGDHT